MSEKIGLLTYGKKEELVFLGKEIGEHRSYSEEIARTIDLEVRRLVLDAYENAKQILSEHRDKLVEVADLLMSQETIDAVTFNAVFS